MATDTNPETFVAVQHAAIRLGVPAAWLKAEAEAGRVPSLRAGRRILVNLEIVKDALLQRASGVVRAESELIHGG